MSDVKSVIEYRLQQSEAAFKMAEIASEQRDWNHVCNRLYYAAFYAVSAYLAGVNDDVRTHNGVRVRVHKLFVKTELVKQEMGGLYDELFNNRQDADYADFAVFSEEDVVPLIPRTREFVEAIKSYINI